MDPNSVHPLLIPHVLEQIFRSSTLSSKDLLSARSVCKEWRIHATKAFASQRTLILADKKSKALLNSAVNLMHNPDSDLPVPVRLSVLSSLFERKNVNYLFETFLNLAAHRLEDITIIVLSKADHAEVSETFGNSLTFPKLRCFELSVTFPATEFKGISLRLATRILTSSARLKEVKILNMGLILPSSTLTETIGHMPSSIQTLYIQNTLFLTSTRILAQLSLPNLKNLKLELKQVKLLNPTDFCQIFNGCKDQLEILSIECCDTHVVVKFPRFERLISLSIHVHDCTTGRKPTHEVENFSKIFPKVSSLMIGRLHNKEILESLFPRGFHAPQVKTCVLSEIIECQEMLRNFSFGFSNLKSLTISPLRVSKMLPVIFENFAGLEELFVFFKEPLKRICIDSVLTGVSKQDCREIRASGNYDSVNLGDVKRRPGISDMSHLKVLEVRQTLAQTRISFNTRFFLTDITGYLGLLRMDNLKKLKTDTFKLTVGCIERLKERFGGDGVTERYKYKPESDFENLCDHSEPNDPDSESDSEFDASDSDSDGFSEMDFLDFADGNEDVMLLNLIDPFHV